MGLRKCDRGPDVRLLQETLTQNGFTVKPTGFFDDQTDQAVRAYQTRMGLLPDGIAGPLTRNSLGIDGKGPCRVMRPKNELEFLRSYQRNSLDLLRRTGVSPDPIRANPMQSMPSRSPHGLCISEKGLRFIYTHEALKDLSNYLHWPTGASGVTLGPGYDMKERSKNSIKNNLKAIGVAPSVADEVAEAAGLEGSEAKSFVKKHSDLVNLSPQQEMQLLNLIAPDYEAIVKRNIHVDLKQHEYDALVCFVYNPGDTFKPIARLINQGHVADAMRIIKGRVLSKGEILQTLVNRRRDEIALYLNLLQKSMQQVEYICKSA